MTEYKITPIETEYAGHRFRSQLEAKWAVLFDLLDLRWRYEPSLFDTPDGGYLPDFFLTLSSGEEVIMEIKPPHHSGYEPRLVHVGKQLGLRSFVSCGFPANRTVTLFRAEHVFTNEITLNYPEAAWGYAFCFCSQCGGVGLESFGYQGLVCGNRCIDGNGLPAAVYNETTMALKTCMRLANTKSFSRRRLSLQREMDYIETKSRRI